MTLAHRVAVMRKGKLQQFDTPMNVYERPANRFVAEFVGSPSMNLIEGSLNGSHAFTNEYLSIKLPDKYQGQLPEHARVTLGIRPEHISIATTSVEGGIAGRVYVTEEMGNETLVVLSVGSLKLTARAPAEFRMAPETPVWLTLAVEKSHLFDAETSERI
jgi:ABC-type sugar transport system ATPase subunit